MAEGDRRLPVGAEVRPGGGVGFRVWAPKRRRVAVVVEGRAAEDLGREPGGYHAGVVRGIGAGARYRFLLDDDPTPYPDPASRFQPQGPHGPSEVVDPATFEWSDRAWKGVRMPGQIIYELHVGTFTREGTWAAAEHELPRLVDLGVTLIEVMPVADFPGRWGWGYDGVDWFAPSRLYGRPDDLRRFVDRAHELGLGVILDVVYNHFGPDGAYWRQFSDAYFHRERETDWGEAINFDGPDCGPVRDLVCANARYWIEEFHLDGLRLDATQDLHDCSEPHIVAEIARHARAAARGRSIVLIAENEPQDTRLVRPVEEGGYGLDAVWNDDFHHSAVVAVTGRNEAYYQDTQGKPQELISAAKWGYLFQGQLYLWQHQRRGTPTFGLPAHAFVNCVQNHDQVANSAFGLRLHELCSPGRYRAITALTLLAPGTPMLFQGQEYASSRPWLYFCDHEEHLGPAIRSGREEFLSQFLSVATPETRAVLPDPTSDQSFERSRLDPCEREQHRPAWKLHRDLIRVRREDAVFREQDATRMHGAVLGPEAFVLRFFGREPVEDRLLLVNLGLVEHLRHVPEPLLAPPAGARWRVRWSSEHPSYGGTGTPELDDDEENWRIPGHAAVVLAPIPTGDHR